jgi:hypothetical protein
MFTRHIRSTRVIAAPALGALLLVLLASGEAQASSKRDAQATRGTVASELASGLRGIHATNTRSRARRATFQTHC